MKATKPALPRSLLALYPLDYPDTPSCRRALRHWRWLVLIPLGLLLPRLAESASYWVERIYARDVYFSIRNAILSFTILIPFSLAELIVLSLLLLVPLGLWCALVRSFRRKSGVFLLRRLLSLGLIFGLGLHLFYITWGFHYAREPLAQRLDLEVRPRETAELYEFVESLSKEAGRLRKQIREQDGISTYSTDIQQTLLGLSDCYRGLNYLYPAAYSGGVGRVKPVLLSKALSKAGIAGIYIGLTAEPNVNVDQPAFSIPMAGAHELAHQLGIASEDEAEFTAFLACLCSPDPFVRYSGVSGMLIRAGNALHGADPEGYAVLYETYDPGVRRDFAFQSAYWKAYDSPVTTVAEEANDRYLRHNGQDSGIKSYGEAVDLALAWYLEQK